MTRFASWLTSTLGSMFAVVAAFLVVLLWAVSYPVWSDPNVWMLVINTTTTIVTFLMVFVIQNTQNRDGRANQVKQDLQLQMTAHLVKELCADTRSAAELLEEATRLIGIEDKPEKAIKVQQDRVRSDSE